MSMTIRTAAEHDIDIIREIYNHYVENSTCTYQTETETYTERAAWFKLHSAEYPVLIAEVDGEAAGWAALSRYHMRAAYKPTVEDSVYVRHDMQHRGIGTRLLAVLTVQAVQLGYHSIIAQISADQTASVALHEKMHFVKVAHLKEVGFKFGRRLDVVFYQLLLQ